MSAVHDCNFKNGCSMLYPTLLLELDTTTFPNYTGFKIENRYYNITDIRSVRNNLFEVSGEVDVLATYKANILSTTAYVIYDNTINTELPDNRLPIKTSKSVSVSAAACPLVPDSGCYILSLTGSHGSTGIYKCDANEFSDLISDIATIMDDLFDLSGQPSPPTPPTSSSIEDAIDYIGNYFAYIGEWWTWAFKIIRYPITQMFGSGNISENIRQCIYIPFNRGTTYGSNRVYLGTYDTRKNLSKLNTDHIVDSVSVSIPWQKSDYRRRSPYTEIYIYLPYIGMQKLSSENLAGQSSINVQYALGMRDGTIVCTITSGGEILGQYGGSVGIAVPVGSSNINFPRQAGAIISAAAAAATKNIGALGFAAINFGESVVPNFSSIGGLDGLAAIATNQNITCYTVLHDTNVEPNSELATIGSPTMAPKQLATLTGFVQTMSASVDGAMTDTERLKINSLLDNGIFIE